MRWTAPDGLEIEGFLTLPRGEAPFPTILHVHGGPIWAFQDHPPKESVLALIEHGYAIFEPNSRGSTGPRAASSPRSSSATWAAATSATCSRASTTSSPRASPIPSASASWA